MPRNSSDSFRDLKLVLALAAIERADEAGRFVGREDRQAWSHEAGLDGLPTDPGPARRLRKLAERARLANDQRLPWTVRPVLLALARCDWPPALTALLLGGALALGWSTLQLGLDRGVNLLGLPLVGLIAWNAAIYLWLAIGAGRRLLRRHRSDNGAIEWMTARVGERAALASLRRGRAETSARWSAVMDFAHRTFEEWRPSFADLAAPVLERRLARTFHLAAALWSVGAIAGLYQQGWSRSFFAYWESTLLDAPAVQAWFSALFSPAATLFNLPLPLAQIPSLEWTTAAAPPPAESARPWFHLYAATLLLVVILPRLALATAAHAGAQWRLRTALRSPRLERCLDEARGLAAAAAGEPAPAVPWTAAVLAGEDDAPPGLADALAAWSKNEGDGGEPQVLFVSPHLEGEARRRLLFEARAVVVGAEKTPDEPRREDLEILREAAARDGGARIVFLDALRFRERFATLPSSEQRWRERQAGWREAVGGPPLRLVWLRAEAPGPAAPGDESGAAADSSLAPPAQRS